MLQQLVAPLDGFGFLKSQFTCQLLHLLHEQIHQLVGVAIEDLAYLADVATILLSAYQALAASLTAVDVVLQAQAVLACLDCFT